MFRPSQALLFRPVPSLLKLQIHQPLPLNPRESKQLLQILTTSFRQQLDLEHGSPTESDSKPRRLPKQNGRLDSRSEAGPTDRHLQSILTNPLFSHIPNGKIALGRGPMDIFDEAVAKGYMTLEHAGSCLYAEKQRIMRSSTSPIRAGMMESGAGRRVLKWLIASGACNDNAFLKTKTGNGSFGRLLMEYMVSENLQEAAWTWIERAFESLSDATTDAKDIARPLLQLVQAEAKRGGSLDAAFGTMAKAARLLEGIPEYQMKIALRPAIRFLYHDLYNHHDQGSRSQAVSPSNFESFLGLVRLIPGDYCSAKLRLLHPTRPAAEHALYVLRNEVFNPAAKHVSTSAAISLGLQTANFLLENDKLKDATWLLEMLRSRYPKELGLEGRDRIEPEVKSVKEAHEEESSLKLLDDLLGMNKPHWVNQP